MAKDKNDTLAKLKKVASDAPMQTKDNSKEKKKKDDKLHFLSIGFDKNWIQKIKEWQGAGGSTASYIKSAVREKMQRDGI